MILLLLLLTMMMMMMMTTTGKRLKFQNRSAVVLGLWR